VWAIGTGETATPEDASSAQGSLRGRLDQRLGAARSTRTPILYGGSVKPDNAAELLAARNVDGVLVGGASVDPRAFAALGAAAG
jgi:triosephosphate isomerase